MREVRRYRRGWSVSGIALEGWYFPRRFWRMPGHEGTAANKPTRRAEGVCSEEVLTLLNCVAGEQYDADKCKE